MAKQTRGRKSIALLMLIIAGLLAMISITSEGRSRFTPAEDLLLTLFAPVQTVFSSAGQSLRSLYDTLASFHQLIAENERLRLELSEVQGQLIQLQELREQNYRFRRMLGFQERSNFELLPAEVIARDPSQWFGAITINRGYLDGVTSEAPVITDRGLVGMVSAVSSSSSQVILITDPRLNVSALVLGSRDHGMVGIVESHDEDPSVLKMSKLSTDISVRPGDVIISSGLGGIFPKGLVIGTVQEVVDDQNSLVKSAVIEPRVKFNRLEELFVVTGSVTDIPEAR